MVILVIVIIMLRRMILKIRDRLPKVGKWYFSPASEPLLFFSVAIWILTMTTMVMSMVMTTVMIMLIIVMIMTTTPEHESLLFLSVALPELLFGLPQPLPHPCGD